MLRQWKKILALLLAMAVVTTTFNSSYASARVFAEDEGDAIETSGDGGQEDSFEGEEGGGDYQEDNGGDYEEPSNEGEDFVETNEEQPAEGGNEEGASNEAAALVADETDPAQTPEENGRGCNRNNYW